MGVKVSVIIPVYNVAKYLRECLDSVVNQTLEDIEIICINDGSTDNSLDILEEYAQKDSRIKVITQENQGVSVARNKGIELACGEYVAFMDSDDFYPENNTLKILYEAAIKYNVNACGGEFAEYDGHKITQNYSKTLKDYLFEKSGIIDYKDFQFDYGYIRFIYNREFLIRNDLKFPNYKRFQDPPFFVKTMSQIKQFYALKQITYVYRVSHKDINWTQEKINGLLNGLKDCFIIARKNNYKKLFKILSNRFLYEYQYPIRKNLNIKNMVLCIKILKLVEKQVLAKFLIQTVFCLSNDVDKKHKIFTILGWRIKFKKHKERR